MLYMSASSPKLPELLYSPSSFSWPLSSAMHTLYWPLGGGDYGWLVNELTGFISVWFQSVVIGFGRVLRYFSIT